MHTKPKIMVQNVFLITNETNVRTKYLHESAFWGTFVFTKLDRHIYMYEYIIIFGTMDPESL